MMETEVDKNINLNVSCDLLTLMFQYTVWLVQDDLRQSKNIDNW